MEIRTYTRILWRWSWLVVSLPVLVVALTLAKPSAPRQLGYSATMRFSVGVTRTLPAEPFYTYDSYYTWLTAEYLADDLTEVIRSQEVAQAVKEEAARRGLTVDVAPGAIQGATSGGKQHRILTVTMGWPDRGQLTVLASALATVLSEGRAPYFTQFRSAGAPILMHLIDPPSIAAVGVSARSRLELPLRLSLALFAGIGLAFLLEYLDDTVRGVHDLQAHGLPVLGAIPRRSAAPWIDRRQR